MFDPNSRYYHVPTATMTVIRRDGTPMDIRYLTRRFIPPSTGATTVVEHTVSEQDRLDTITARYLDDPTQFWIVCDANDVLRPAELERVGRLIKITMPNE